MRIRALDPLPPLVGPATVIVNAEDFAVDLSEFESGSIFLRDTGGCISTSQPVVVVNPTVDFFHPLADQIVDGRIASVELWADAAGIEGLLECTMNFDAIAVSRASIDEIWVKLRLVTSVAHDRPASDLALGLSAAKKGVGNPITQKLPDQIPSTDEAGAAKAEFVRVAAKLMKPIKPYLPKQLIHLMYKILGALR